MSDAAPTPSSDPVLGHELSQFLQQPWVQHALASLVAFAIAWGIWRLLMRGIITICQRTRFADLQPLILKVVRWAYWLLAMLFILQQAGVDTQSLWTAITATTAMIAVGFIAVWSVLSNLIASFLILGARLFRPRDEVELLDVGGGTVRGQVRAIELMFTLIEERHDGRTTLLKIPNNLFFQKVMRVHPAAGAETVSAEEGARSSREQPLPVGVVPDSTLAT